MSAYAPYVPTMGAFSRVERGRAKNFLSVQTGGGPSIKLVTPNQQAVEQAKQNLKRLVQKMATKRTRSQSSATSSPKRKKRKKAKQGKPAKINRSYRKIWSSKWMMLQKDIKTILHYLPIYLFKMAQRQQIRLHERLCHIRYRLGKKKGQDFTNLQRPGNTRIHIKFQKPLLVPVTDITYGTFEGFMNIDEDRNVLLNA